MGAAARGMRGANGINGSNSTLGSAAAGAGAGADFFFLVALFLVFLLEAAAMPIQRHSSARRRTHAMTGM